MNIYSSLGDKILIGQGLFDIDNVSDTVFVGTLELLPSPVDLVGFDCLAIWPDLVLGAKVKALLGGCNTSNQ